MTIRAIPRSCVLKTQTQERSVEMAHEILDAVVRMLSVGGTEPFYTNAVAARAVVSVSSLYRYFAAKDILMVAVTEREANHARGVQTYHGEEDCRTRAHP